MIHESCLTCSAADATSSFSPSFPLSLRSLLALGDLDRDLCDLFRLSFVFDRSVFGDSGGSLCFCSLSCFGSTCSLSGCSWSVFFSLSRIWRTERGICARCKMKTIPVSLIAMQLQRKASKVRKKTSCHVFREKTKRESTKNGKKDGVKSTRKEEERRQDGRKRERWEVQQLGPKEGRGQCWSSVKEKRCNSTFSALFT